MKKAATKRTGDQQESIGQRVLPLARVIFTLRRELRELVGEAGTQALTALLEAERTEVCGER